MPSGWTYPSTGNMLLGSLHFTCKSRHFTSLIPSAWCFRGSKAALGGLCTVPVWRDGEGGQDCGCDAAVWFEYPPAPAEQRSIVSLSRATPCWQLLCACKPIPHFSSLFLNPFYFSFPLFSLSVSLSLLIFLYLLVFSSPSIYSCLLLICSSLSVPPSLRHTRPPCSFYLPCCHVAWG